MDKRQRDHDDNDGKTIYGHTPGSGPLYIDWDKVAANREHYNHVAQAEKEEQLQRVEELYNLMIDKANTNLDWKMCEYIKELTVIAQVAIKEKYK